jgi:hypothetical protein
MQRDELTVRYCTKGAGRIAFEQPYLLIGIQNSILVPRPG